MDHKIVKHGRRNWRARAKSVCTHLCVLACILPAKVQGACPCTSNEYCFSGTDTFCSPCHSSCIGCTGPGPDECKACIPGYDQGTGRCAPTTVAPPTTTPLVIGPEVFLDMTFTNHDGVSVVTWLFDTSVRHLSWDITLSYQKIGIGDCESGSKGETLSFAVNRNQSSYSFSDLEPWTKYRFSLTAVLTGATPAVNRSKSIEALTGEVVPTGVVSNIRIRSLTSTSVTLGWVDVPCNQRGGSLLNYVIDIWPTNGEGASQRLQTRITNVTFNDLIPFTSYKASFQCSNKIGTGNSSVAYNFSTPEGVPGPVNIFGLEPTVTSIAVNFYLPDPANGIIQDYSIHYSTSETFNLSKFLIYSASSLDVPEIQMLKPNTEYHVKVRAATGAGYGSYGNVMSTRTLIPSTDPISPSAVVQNLQNSTCIGVTWTILNQPTETLTGIKVTVKKQSNEAPESYEEQLEPNASEYVHCGLDPGTAYVVTIVSFTDWGVSDPVEVLMYTEQSDPPQPPEPILRETFATSAMIEIEPVTIMAGPLVTYQIQVEIILPKRSRRAAKISTITSLGRKRRHYPVPGYVTAEISALDFTERILFLIGDGLIYGSVVNEPLEPNQQFEVYYVVLSTLNNLTKYSYSKMSNDIYTLNATNRTTQNPAQPQKEKSNNNAVIIGTAIILVIVIIIILIIIRFIYWRRRKNMLLKEPHQLILDKSSNAESAVQYPPEVVSGPETYWNQTNSLDEFRYIVAGRDCLPEVPALPEQTGIGSTCPVTFRNEFQSIPHKLKELTTNEAENHRELNRFPHILAYDHTRVALVPENRYVSSTYINANYMSGYNRQHAYVAAQSPFNDRTAEQFWCMIHQLSVTTVVMMTNIIEENIVKCIQYWPQEGQGSIGPFLLALVDEVQYSDYTVRDISVIKNQEEPSRIVRLYEFTSWPEHGVPDDPIPFLDMRHKVRQYHGDDPSPIVVHCGTGVSRSGVFIAVDSLIDQYLAEGRISVYSFVREMRKERPFMVRTYKQYAFIYDTLFEELHAGRTRVNGTNLRELRNKWMEKNIKSGRSVFHDQFQLLQRFSLGPEVEHCATAILPINVHKNIHPEIIPSDLYRPKLVTNEIHFFSDYINAVFVDGYKQAKQFIVTQTPLHTTVVDFWRLVYDYNVQTIVTMQSHTPEDKSCPLYWPSDVTRKQWEPFFIELSSTQEEEHVKIRNFKICNSNLLNNELHFVRQFEIQAASENGATPVSRKRTVRILRRVREYQKKSPFPNSPIVVHCKDGATLSGLFVVLSVMLERIEANDDVDLYHTIKHIKRRRPQILSTYNQFQFCYKTLWNILNLRQSGNVISPNDGRRKDNVTSPNDGRRKDNVTSPNDGRRKDNVRATASLLMSSSDFSQC